jgi:beta-mannosidase
MEKISLSGEWLLRQCTGEHRWMDIEDNSNNWLPAQVPGTVHQDLLRADVIPDPFRRLNEKEVAWVDERNWLYLRKFELSEDFLNNSPAELIFHGLDTYAEIALNGYLLGKSENMFTSWRRRVEAYLKPGHNVLAIRFSSALQRVKDIAKEDNCPFIYGGSVIERGYARKALYSFGWDWGPELATSGIWKDVELVFPYKAALSDVHFTSKVEGNIAYINVDASVTGYTPGCYTVRYMLSGHGYTETMQKEIIDPTESTFTASTEFAIDNPKLWWPAGYGDPSLYNLHVELLDGETLLDTKDMHVGIRTVELIQEPDEIGESFYFRINGVPVFAKGANWIPGDSFLPRVDKAKYQKLIDMAKEANMNMLRVWGGGIYEDDAFYNACDERGIMVWQDFMFACYEVPEAEWFHKLVEEEAKENIIRLRNHPSLMLWCGNNENDTTFYGGQRKLGKTVYYGDTIYSQILPRICSRLDPDRPYWRSSPSGGEHPNCQTHGDRHSWDVFGGRQPYANYRQDHGRFLSEFGFQALPTMQTIRTFTDESDLSPNSDVMKSHNKMVGGMERLGEYLDTHFQPYSDFEEYLAQTQINQGEAMRCGIEHWRSHKFDTSGTLIWQLNDCWPVSSWSLIDYGNRRKAAYYFVKRAFAPVMLSIWPGEEEIEINLINDTLNTIGGTAEVCLVDACGETIWQHKASLSAGANGTGQIIIPVSALPDEAKDGTILLASVYNKNGTVACSQALFRPMKDLCIPAAELAITSIEPCKHDGFIVTISAEDIACYVHLASQDAELSCSDNWFHMLPGEKREIVVYPVSPINPDSIKVQCLNRRIQAVSYAKSGRI